MTSVFSLLSWLNVIGGTIALVLSLFTANFGLLALAIVALAHAAAWEQLDKLSEEFEELKTHCGMT